MHAAGAVAAGKLVQVRAAGARLLPVDGTFEDAFAAALKLAEDDGYVFVNSTNPHRLEGQKTAAFELVDDLGAPTPTSGDLTPWADAGVMLLNRSLTVTPGQPASHRGRGWEPVTDQAIRVLAKRAHEQPLTAILWGRDAQSLKAELAPIPWVESAHPSPLSAYRGFFGSRPFSRVNRMLEEQGGTPVDWRLP